MTAVPLPATVAFFHAMCLQIQAENSLSLKSDMIQTCVQRYSGDLVLLFKLLLPKYVGRVYHLKDKQLIKLLSSLLGVAEGTLKDHSDKTGCIATSAAHFFKSPRTTSTMTLAELEASLAALAAVTMEDQQRSVLAKFLANATKSDLFVFLREVKLDLRLGAGIRIVLAGLHPSANDLYKQSANIADVVKKVLAGDTEVVVDDDGGASGSGRSTSPSRVKGSHITASITLGVPVSPMLAAPSRGAAAVIAKCPNGCYSETKYDGERIQIHKQGSKFSFFARSTKEMKADKYEGLEEHIMAAVKATDCILDGEILLVDRSTSRPLPFGTLGKHKKAEFSTANTAVFLFDILYLDGESLLNVPLDKRRDLLRRTVELIPNRIFYSDLRIVSGSKDEQTALLEKHLQFAISTGLEGLVVKDIKSTYEPGARHWLKLKKDYLDGCGDTADLILLGAWYGTGTKGGKLSVFLMGVLDTSLPATAAGRFKTVTSVANGLDDEKLDAWQPVFNREMVKTNGVAPAWLAAHSSNVPDMVFKDPTAAPVFEVMCNEYTVSKVHTAANISMRFGRIIRHRDDKDPSTATSLEELKKLVVLAKEHALLPLEDEAPNKEPELAPTARVATRPGHAAPAATAHSGPQLVQTKLNFAAPTARPQPPPVPPAVTTRPPTSSAAATSVGSLLRTVTHDVAQPISVPGVAQPNFLIVHCVALRGKWSNRGVMGSITTNHGDECKEAYESAAARVNLGDLVVVEVSNRLSSGKMYIANLIAQTPPSAPGTPPQVDMDALLRGLAKAASFASKNECTIHLARPDKSTGVNWGAVEALINEKFIPAGIHTTVYLREGGGLGGRTSTTLDASPAASLQRFSTVGVVAASPSPIPTAAAASRGPTAAAPTQVKSPASSARPSAGHAPSSVDPVSASLHSEGSGEPNFMSSVKLVAIVGDPDAGYLTARQAEAVRQKALMMGAISAVSASPTSDLPPATSHVITDGARPAKVPSTAYVLPRAWVDACFAENRLLDPRKYSLGPLPTPPEPTRSSSSLTQQGSMSGLFTLFADFRLVLSPTFDSATAASLANQVRMMGGVVQSSWLSTGLDRSTHYVAPNSHCTHARKFIVMGECVVTPKWITDSFENARLADARKYLISDSGSVSVDAPSTSPRKVAAPAPSPRSAAFAVPPPTPAAVAPTVTRRARTPDFVRGSRDMDAIVTELRSFAVSFRAGESVRTEFAKITFAAVGYPPHIASAIEAALVCLGAQRAVNPANAVVMITDTLTDLTVSRMASFNGASADHGWTVRLSWVVDCVRGRRRMPYHTYIYGLSPRHSSALSVAPPAVEYDDVCIAATNAPSSIGKTFVDHNAPHSTAVQGPDLSPVKAKATHLSPQPSPSSKTHHVESALKPLMLPSVLDMDSDEDSPPPPARVPRREPSQHSDSTMSYEFNDVDSDDDTPPPPKRRQQELAATVLVANTDSDDDATASEE